MLRQIGLDEGFWTFLYLLLSEPPIDTLYCRHLVEINSRIWRFWGRGAAPANARLCRLYWKKEPINRAGHSLLFTLFANRYSATPMYHFAIATPLLFWILQCAIRYSLFATSFDKSDAPQSRGLYTSMEQSPTEREQVFESRVAQVFFSFVLQYSYKREMGPINLQNHYTLHEVCIDFFKIGFFFFFPPKLSCIDYLNSPHY
jgi:hypothetical protein